MTAHGQPLHRRTAFIATLALLAASALGLTLGISKYKVMLRKFPIRPGNGRLLLALPSETESFIRVGPDRRENAEVEKTLGTTNYISRRYEEKTPRDPAKPVRLELHCAYYTGMIDTVPHVPERCFVGGGMQIGNMLGEIPLPLDASRWSIDTALDSLKFGDIYTVRLGNKSEKAGTYVRLPRNPKDIRMNVTTFLVGEGDLVQHAGYFFIANGGWVAKANDVRLLAFDLKTKYAYYCKVQCTGLNFASAEEFTAASARLLDELLGEIMLCLPDWPAVVLAQEAGNPVPGADAQEQAP
jgi:hypothetical protein